MDRPCVAIPLTTGRPETLYSEKTQNVVERKIETKNSGRGFRRPARDVYIPCFTTGLVVRGKTPMSQAASNRKCCQHSRFARLPSSALFSHHISSIVVCVRPNAARYDLRFPFFCLKISLSMRVCGIGFYSRLREAGQVVSQGRHVPQGESQVPQLVQKRHALLGGEVVEADHHVRLSTPECRGAETKEPTNKPTGRGGGGGQRQWAQNIPELLPSYEKWPMLSRVLTAASNPFTSASKSVATSQHRVRSDRCSCWMGWEQHIRYPWADHKSYKPLSKIGPTERRLDRVVGGSDGFCLSSLEASRFL